MNMKKFSDSEKEKHGIILDLVNGFLSCKNMDEAIIFLGDLLTKKELEILSRRLRIAKLLLEGKDYREIQRTIHVSHGTIAKISAWLAEKGDGFRNAIKRLPKESKNKDFTDYSVWKEIEDKYPMYFLPERIIEKIIKEKILQKDNKTKIAVKNLESSLSNKRVINKQIEKQYKKS